MNAVGQIPIIATIQVHNGRAFWTAKGEKQYFRTASDAREGVEFLRKRAFLGDREYQTLLADIATLEANSGSGVAAQPSNFEKAPAKAKTSAASRAPLADTLVSKLETAIADRAKPGVTATEPETGIVDTPTPWQSVRSLQTIDVKPRALAELKGQPAANAWLQNMGSKVLHHVALKQAGKPSDIVLSAALVGPDGVGRRLAAEIYTTRLHAQRAISEPKLHVIDLRRLLDDGHDLEEYVKGLGGVVLIENTHILDREQHTKELQIIEALATGGNEPVVLLSGSSELRSTLDSHWRLKDAFKAQIVFSALSPEVLTEIFVGEATRYGFTVDADAHAAATGRFRSTGKAGGEAAKKLFAEAKERLALRLFPEGELPTTPPTAEDLSTIRVDDLKTASLGDINKLPSIIRIDARIGQAEAKAWMRRIALKIADDRERQARGEKVRPLNLNIVITGDPGTGKTTLVEYLNELLVELGLRNGKVIYKTAMELKGAHAGEGEANVRQMYEDGEGGIVCIDETHQLREDDAGRMILKTMMPLANNKRETTTTILIGYAEPIDEMYDVDSGMSRRFPKLNRVDLTAYSLEELGSLVRDNAERLEYDLAPGALEAALRVLEIARNGKNFGNAGDVENLVDRATVYAAARERVPGQRQQLVAEDFCQAEQESAIDKLDGYVGLDHLKPELEAIGHAVDAQRAANLPVNEAVSPCALLVGPTGSGRKSVAGVLSNVYASHGIIGEAKPRMKSLTSFKGQHLGDSELNVRAAFSAAIGGHLVLSGLGPLLENYDSYHASILNEVMAQISELRGRLAVSIVGTDAEIEALLNRDADGVIASLFGQRYELEAFDATAAAAVLAKKLGRRELHPEAQARVVELMGRLIAAPKWNNGLDIESLVQRVAHEQSALRSQERYAGWAPEVVSLEALGRAVDRMIKNKGGKPSHEIWDKSAVSPTSPALRAPRATKQK